MAKLAVRNLTKTFGANAVLREISFEVADGEFCVLLGPSGCGKTTLLRLVAGLEEASGGMISLDGQRIDDLPPQKRDVAFVFQSYALYPHMSVYENMAFSLRLRRLPEDGIRQRVREAARLLEIEGQLEQKPQELSGGQRQRVAVGRAIVRQPKIFLFDEPLSNLDASLRASMRVELARLHRRLRATILYITHDQAEAMTLGEKIIVLHEGKIQQLGSSSAIYRRPANPFVGRFVGSPQMNLIEGRLDEKRAVFRSGGLEIDLSEALSEGWEGYAGKALTVGIRPEDLLFAGRDDAWAQAEVEIIEDLGSDRFVHLRCGEMELLARIPAHMAVNRGEVIRLTGKPSRLHLFHQGKRVQ
ncbi:MAG: sn-glycerol-3-phosphate ABC transporter ATP-binding protein UgpC [Deltaproteobacteria bacterium]|nr:sn-glycerol-3-phosphate ABC transporter ATP-binding protein UgpC [Deltaproteobacteria bacterium]